VAGKVLCKLIGATEMLVTTKEKFIILTHL
jgi:hypothetical protein